MGPPKPSAFFHQQQLDIPAPRAVRHLGHRQRRMLAWMLGFVIMAGAAMTAIYLAHPERFRRAQRETPRPAEQVYATTTEREPGVWEVEVQRGGAKQTFYFRRVSGKTVIEDVTPKEERKRSWSERLWGE